MVIRVSHKALTWYVSLCPMTPSQNNVVVCTPSQISFNYHAFMDDFFGLVYTYVTNTKIYIYIWLKYDFKVFCFIK